MAKSSRPIVKRAVSDHEKSSQGSCGCGKVKGGNKIAELLERNKSEALRCVFETASQSKKEKRMLWECHASTSNIEGL